AVLLLSPDVTAAAYGGSPFRHRDRSLPCSRIHGHWPFLPSLLRHLLRIHVLTRSSAPVFSRQRSLLMTPASMTNWRCQPSRCQRLATTRLSSRSMSLPNLPSALPKT